MCEIDPGTHKGMHSVLLLKTGCDNMRLLMGATWRVYAALCTGLRTVADERGYIAF
jgi:hypothetical protein